MPASSAAKRRCARCATSSPRPKQQRESIAGGARRVARAACRARAAARRAAGRGQSAASRRTATRARRSARCGRRPSRLRSACARITAETEELERDHESRAGAIAEARARLQEGIDAMAEFEDRARRARAGARRAAPEPVVQALAGADRSRRRAGSCDQGRVEALGAALDFARASSGCAISSNSCSSGATS